MTWRVAGSLEALLAEVNQFAPNRSKAADGGIGDAAHASRTSDHNPYIKDSKGIGVVRARDFTHDPARGFDSYSFARSLARSNDPRLRYLISNGEWWKPGWTSWQKYTGSNPHDHHAHVSVDEGPQSVYDSKADWKWEAAMVPMPGDRPIIPQITDPVLKRGMKEAATNTTGPIHKLQKLLGVKADGDFGPATQNAVKAFQSARGLTSDGVVGLYTWRALNAAPSAPAGKVIIPASIFDRVIEYVIDDEGSELNLSPNEPGGASRYGISIDTMSKYTGRKAVPQDLRNLTPAEAAKIYRKLYWDVIGADKLATGLNYAAFDFAVNSGVATVDQKGMDDYLTKALAENTVDKEIDKLSDLRLERMRANPDWLKYKNGWSARVSRVRSRAHALAA